MTVDRADLGPLLGRLRLAGERQGFLPSTLEKRQIHVLAFYRYLKRRGIGLFAATPEDVETFLDARNLVARSRYTWLAGLHVFYAWAIREDLTDADPTAKIIRPRLRRSLPRPIKTSDLQAAIDLAPPVMKAWLLLASLQGLRCQEIATLKRSDVLWDDDILRVVHGKGDKQRLVPLHPEVRKALLALPIRQCDRLWTRPRGGDFTPNNVSLFIGRYLRANGIQSTAHALRHWYGTEMYRSSGHDIRMVQELMGHESPITTAVYTDWTRPAAVDAVRALAIGQRTRRLGGPRVIPIRQGGIS